MVEATLPSDFHTALDNVSGLGILEEGAADIDARLADAMAGAAARAGQRPMDAGFTDWVSAAMLETKRAIHQEICAADGAGVKPEYDALFKKGLSPEGITAISTVITAIVSPTYAVSTVLIYLSVWLLKVGANRWCALPPS